MSDSDHSDSRDGDGDQDNAYWGDDQERKAGDEGAPKDYANDYDGLLEDVLGDDSGSDSDTNQFSAFMASKAKRTKKQGKDSSKQERPFLFYDFRRGRENWPNGVDVVDAKAAEELLTVAKAEANKAKDKKKGGDDDFSAWSPMALEGFGNYDPKSPDFSSMMMDDLDDDVKTVEVEETTTKSVAPPHAKFETLKDNSTALLIPAGTRLKIDVNALTDDTWQNHNKPKKKKKKTKKLAWDTFGPSEGGWKKWWKEWVNEYTITMDVKFSDEIPREGIALFQTALIHVEENAKTGRKRLKQSDGECVINSAGGVGVLGSFGDVTKAKVEKDRWKRIVISVKTIKAGGDGRQKGELRTWIDSVPCAIIKHESLVQEGRFAISPDTLFLFSSGNASMMPGGLAVRSIRIDKGPTNDGEVKTQRARDKVVSMFNEERKAEVDHQRKSLSLSKLFAKPRPVWLSPALIATFGDAYIEGTGLEGNSCLAWSFTVLNDALQRAQYEQGPFLCGMETSTRGAISDTLHVLQQSAPIFKLMLKLLKTPTDTQLMSFLRRVRKLLQALSVGESLLFPALVELYELLILVERVSEGQYRFVVVQTDPFEGLRHHPVSPASPPKIKFRTCMVLSGVSKKNALDDVFWVAVYNLAIHSHPGDTDRFYDILVPFLTGKPLEVSLVEAEMAADTPGGVGPWRSPQRSDTPYVRCILEAVHYMLRTRGLSNLQAKQVNLALRAQFVHMIKNDIEFILPDENGQRVCNLACAQLSFATVKLANAFEKAEKTGVIGPGKAHEFGSAVLDNVRLLVDDVRDKLTACIDHETALPPRLDLSGSGTVTAAPMDDIKEGEDPALMQFADSFAWDAELNSPDPGQVIFLSKYVPIDMMQLPRKVTTRAEAVRAIRMCDRLCSLLDNQSHCVKNDKFLIVSLITHVFTQLVKLPLPRPWAQDKGVAHTAERTDRRRKRTAARTEAKRAEQQKKKKTEETKGDAAAEEKEDPAAEDGDYDSSDVDITAPIGESRPKKERKQRTKSRTRSESAGKRLKLSPEVKPEEVKQEKEDVPSVTNNSDELKTEPDFAPGIDHFNNLNCDGCIWNGDITYDLQLEILLTIARLCEHFAAAAMSIQQTRSFDAVCIIVPGCMAAVADVVMRKRAVDHPSEQCTHLMGQTRDGRQLGIPGFGLSVSTFATQTETIEVHAPELHVARTAVLDYFQSPQQKRLGKFMKWEDNFILKPGKPLIKYLRNVCREVAAPSTRPYTLLISTCPDTSILMKNYPELHAYRDIAFWWKFFLNPDRMIFPNSRQTGGTMLQRWDRMSVQLMWSWDSRSGGYRVCAFDQSLNLTCRPNPNQTDPLTGKIMKDLPTHRFPSTATPSFFVPKPELKTEDDVIYRPNLPSFEDKSGAVLGQRDAELLISFLTVPYIRLPLVLTFFASEDRVHKLRSTKLRGILDSVMFEPSRYLSTDLHGVEPVMVPTQHPQLLATPYGLLINELHRSPDTVLRGILALLASALTLDTGSVCDAGAEDFNTSVDIILYVSRLAARVENHISFLVDHTKGIHECLDLPLRDVEVTSECLAKLEQGRASVQGLLHGDYDALLQDYLTRLDDQVRKSPTDEQLIDRNSRLASDLHAHRLLFYRNVRESELSTTSAKAIIGSFVYLTTRHTWGKATREEGQLLVPETELYEMLQVQRRRLVTWCRTLKQGPLDDVMQTSLQISASTTGSLRVSAEIVDAQNRWSRLQGPRSVGRYAVASSRTVAEAEDEGGMAPPTLLRQQSETGLVGEVGDTGLLGIEMDIQIGQMTLRSRHLSALETQVANHPDVKAIFGDATMQASLLEKAENRRIFHLVGVNHELHCWGGHKFCPPLGDEWERDYDPAELFESEKWIVALWEPVRKNFFDGPSPPPMQFLMTEKALPENSELCVLLGLHPKLGGPFKLVYIFKRLRCVHVYECISHGQQWWWCLHLATDVRYSLRELQPFTGPRKTPYPEWWLWGAGQPYPAAVGDFLSNYLDEQNQDQPGPSDPASSVVIVRNVAHPSNLSGGSETLVPSRLLYGLIPHCLLDVYRFWEDESRLPPGTDPAQARKRVGRNMTYKRLRGYPIAEDADHIIIVEIQYVGSWLDVMKNTGNASNVLEITGLPGRSVRVTRYLKAEVEKDFQQRQRVAAVLESMHLLSRPEKRQDKDLVKVDQKEEDEENKEEEKLLDVGDQVECDFEGYGEHWPCTVLNVNAAANTVDIEYTGNYTWVGVVTDVSIERVFTKANKEKRKAGEGLWHWQDMTDSEDKDWASRSSGDEGSEREKKEDVKKDRLAFEQFTNLDQLFKIAGEEKVVELLSRLQGQTFTTIAKLVDALRTEVGAGKEKDSTSSITGEVMLNLLYAPRRSRLHSLSKTLARIENLSYICVWTKRSNLGAAATVNFDNYRAEKGCPPIDLVELPRLKLSFTSRKGQDGELRLYSMDHADLFVTNDRPLMSSKILAGIPHSLLLSNLQGEMQVLVPLVKPPRPHISSEPFSTHLVLDRSDAKWMASLSQRYYMYPIHVSLSFLMTQGLNTALYLMLLRFLHRDYEEVYRLADSISTDTQFSPEGQEILKAFHNTMDDWHPDSHACKLKISLVTIDSKSKMPWNLTLNAARYIVKLPHVSANCRISAEEELQLLETDGIKLEENPDPEVLEDEIALYSRLIVKNRLHALRAQLAQGGDTPNGETVSAQCWVPPRAASTAWPYYQDNTIFGEQYSQMVEVQSREEWLEKLAPPPTDGPSPPEGWLTVVVCHVLWSTECLNLLPAIKDLAPSYPYVNFVGLRADVVTLAPIAQELEINSFPTIMFFRGKNERKNEDGTRFRVTGNTRTAERIVHSITAFTSEVDKRAYATKLRLAREAKETKDDEEEYDDDDKGFSWSWDLEHCGPQLRVEDMGMTVMLKADEDDDETTTWEWTHNHRSDEAVWQQFSRDIGPQIEKAYRSGQLYRDGNIHIRNVERPIMVYMENVQISSNLVEGFSGEYTVTGEYVSVRRSGPRYPVKGEPKISKDQAQKDKQILVMQEQQEKFKKMLLNARRGKDVEIIRGTSGLNSECGLEKWTLKWKHEPSRGGRGDAVGLCAEASEHFGPMPSPALGASGAAAKMSIGLYANGDLIFDGQVITKVPPRREPPVVKEQAAEDPSKSPEKEPDSKKKSKSKRRQEPEPEPTPSPAVADGEAVVSEEEKKEAAPVVVKPVEYATCWGKNDLVTVVFDGSVQGGLLTFEINGTPLPDIQVKNVFSMLNGATLVFPSLCLAPFTSETPTPEKDGKDKKDAKKEGGGGDDSGSDNDDDASEDMDEERKEAMAQAKMLNISFDVWEEMDPEAREKLLEKHQNANANDLVPSVTLMGAAPILIKKEKTDTKKSKKDGKTDGENEEATESKAVAAETDGGEDDEESGGEEGSGREGAAQREQATKDEDDAVPISKIIWMYECEKGWENLGEAKSRQLEEARRAGKQKFSLRLGEETLNFKLVGNLEVQMEDGKKNRARRHVIGDGLAGQWEMLSMKYSPPVSVRGAAALTTLETIWGKGECMEGKKHGLGFLFLYSLLQGHTRAKMISTGWGEWGGFEGGAWGGWGGGSSSHDSHRFAILLYQLFTDRSTKSVPASTINIMCRNKTLCPRLPKFKDSRKIKQTPVFNGWTDDREPRSPLADLFSQLTPIFQNLKRKRGALTFPPRPPHPELDQPPETCLLPRLVIRSPSEAAQDDAPISRDWLLPELSDFSCSKRELRPVVGSELSDLASTIRLSVNSGSKYQARAPVLVENDRHFDRLMKEAGDGLVAVEFFATWCSPCKIIGPLFRMLALKTPTIRFLKVDIDVCDKLTKSFNVHAIPTIKVFRGGGLTSAYNNIGTIEGSEHFIVNFMTLMAQVSNKEEAAFLMTQVDKTRVAKGGYAEASKMGCDLAALQGLASSPLASLSNFVRDETKQEVLVDSELLFNIENHESAKSAVARSMMQRIKTDVKAWASKANSSSKSKVADLYDSTVSAFFDGDATAEAKVRASLQTLQRLLSELRSVRDVDARAVQEAIPLLEGAANFVGIEEVPKVEVKEGAAPVPPTEQDLQRIAKLKYLLRRQSGQESTMWLTFLFGSLLSSKAAHDMKRLNPYLQNSSIQVILDLVTLTILRTNRVGHANRCIAAALNLVSMIEHVLELSQADRQLRKQALMPSVIQSGEALARQLITRRWFVHEDQNLSYDPRYLVFEFTWNIMLRKKQVEIVDNFMATLRENKSKVKQMIMGAGKTTVVAPLLALMLADGSSLILSVVPRALVEMSRKLMRETFATIMQKRIYTLKYDRSTIVQPAMCRSLQNAVRNRGIVVCTPTTIKSVMLSYIEVLQGLTDCKKNSLSARLKELSVQAVELSKMLRLFREGVMLLDEVDLILHPLKSELNFPIGEKFDLDVSEQGERWGLPIHLMDAMFFTRTGKITTFEQRGTAVDILRRLANAVEEGFRCRALQRLPHITLLNPAFYHQQIKPVIAEWAYLWLQKQHLHGISRSEAMQYLLEGATARSAATTKIQLIDLAINKTNIESGQRPSEPEPTHSHLDAIAMDPAKQRARTASQVAAADPVKLKAELEQLTEAKTVSQQQQTLINTVCDLDDQLDKALKESGVAIAHIQKRIAGINKRIEEMEFPQDDSLDNAVVVWLSQAFNANVTVGASGIINPVHNACTMLEDSGLTVKRCDVLEEAVDRVRDLQQSGRLRCVIAGGDGVVGCSMGCNDDHSTLNCLVCKKPWGHHNGHHCPQDDRQGSFPTSITNKSNQLDYLAFMKELTSTDTAFARKFSAVPKARTAMFNAGAIMPEIERLAFWRLGVIIPEDSKDLMTWTNMLPAWPKVETKEEEDAEELPVAASADGDEDMPGPPTLTRQISVGSLRLQKLRKQLEILEKQKLALLDVEDNKRKSLRAIIADKHRLLIDSIDGRVSTLQKAVVRATALGKNGFKAIAEQRTAIGPSSGRDAALALAWLALNDKQPENIGASVVSPKSGRAPPPPPSPRSPPPPPPPPVDQKMLASCVRKLQDEIVYLGQTALAAKVVAFVSLVHKKLLNLSHDWLKCFLPHCLGKVNRVSFGLLNDNEAKEALLVDPHVPRSRLKLAVPFVGKDVPSQSSEFAHPEVIIGLTVLAYRYSGLRREEDFADIIDSMTTEFSHEIGPARDRASSRRHETWVLEAGGTIRGIKQPLKGTIPLEQPQHALLSPSADDDSRADSKLAENYQSLLTHVSSSSQTTLPSPAPPAEANVAQNSEPMDDFPTTISLPDEIDDPTSREVVQLKYLQRSNDEQMAKLYSLWMKEPNVIHHYLCKTIFPGHMRHQMFKISASGQSVGGDMLVGRRVGFSGTPSDLLPKELGKCDYETGDDGKMLTTVLDTSVMDSENMPGNWDVEFLLQRVANAEKPRFHSLIDTGALITGYTNEQVARELLKRGLSWCDGVVFLDDADKQQVLVRATDRVVNADQCGISLERRFAFYDQIHTTGMDISHVVNARAVITLGKDMVFRDYVQGAFRMRGIGAGQTITVYIIPEVAELIQRELTAASAPGTVVNALAGTPRGTLVDIAAWLVINSMRSEQIQWNMLCLQNVANIYRKNAFQTIYESTSYFIGENKEHKAQYDPNKSLALFSEAIDFSLEAAVPDPVPFGDKLRVMLEENSAFIATAEQHEVGHSVLVEVGEHALLDESPQRLETEQEREQEQEQQKEVRARRDQQVEVEKFVDREYSRNEEAPRPWHISMLAKYAAAPKHDELDLHPFYPLHEFRLRHQEPLKFPGCLYVSRNYFNPQWAGLRRVKNVVMVLEWTPNSSNVRLLTPEECTTAVGKLTPIQEQGLAKAYQLLSFHGHQGGANDDLGITKLDLYNAVNAATDCKLNEAQLDEIISKFGKNSRLSLAEFRQLLSSGHLRREEKDRFWVAVSLAEAETLRRLMHIRLSKPLVDGARVEAALRYAPTCSPAAPLAGDSGDIFDTSLGWRGGTKAYPYHEAVAHNCFRFFDSEMHFTDPGLNVGVRALQACTPNERERFFTTTIGCRRRMERKWQETPVAKILTVPDEWAALKYRAFAVFMREAIAAKQLTLWEAFTVFDADNNGLLSPAEFYGALRWLNVPDCTPEDVVDFIAAADLNHDNSIDYKEYIDAIRDPDEVKEGEEDENSARTTLPPKIEPYGGEELRELMIKRKREEMMRARDELLRRQAYQQTLDMKLFEEEFKASQSRKGGANPRLYPGSLPPYSLVNVVEFRFTQNDFPLRLVATGKHKLQLMNPPPRESKKIQIQCPRDHDLTRIRRRYNVCNMCSRQDTQFRCSQCDYDICQFCYEQKSTQLSKSKEGHNDPTTFLSCSDGCSFAVQVPAQAKSVLQNQIEYARFTITMEVKIDKLPLNQQIMALLRFSPSEMSRSRRRNIASVYLDSHGYVSCSPEGAGDEDENTNMLITDQKTTDSKTATTTGPSIKAREWCVVTISVDAVAGKVETYINGELSSRQTGREEDLTLKHKLVVFGGGKRGESKGGCVRRIFLHDRPLSAEEVSSIASLCLTDIRGKPSILWLDMLAIKKKKGKEEKVVAPGDDQIQVLLLELARGYPPAEGSRLVLPDNADMSPYEIRKFQKQEEAVATLQYLLTKSLRPVKCVCVIPDRVKMATTDELDNSGEEAVQAAMAAVDEVQGATTLPINVIVYNVVKESVDPVEDAVMEETKTADSSTQEGKSSAKGETDKKDADTDTVMTASDANDKPSEAGKESKEEKGDGSDSKMDSSEPVKSADNDTEDTSEKPEGENGANEGNEGDEKAEGKESAVPERPPPKTVKTWDELAEAVKASEPVKSDLTSLAKALAKDEMEEAEGENKNSSDDDL